ncbi:MAG: hypothetical protein JSV56_07870 [Methanomassiliicoccales archaeon]|nr:MAG: hypothetical protein JSV56_07870 [Methanomassiliicoccales archaeon]
MKFTKDDRHLNLVLAPDSFRPKIVAPPPSFKPSEQSANFILIKVLPGTIERNIEILRSLKGISGVHPVYGEYDLVLIVREKYDVDKHKLMKSIWAISDVIDVQTLIAAS